MHSISSCYVGYDRLFVYPHSSDDCLMLNLDANSGTYSIEYLAKTDQARVIPCEVNVNDKFVFLIGGLLYPTNQALATVSRYEIATNSWSKGPQLNIARCNSSACFLGGNIYVFGGQNRQYQMTNSIEKLRVASLNSVGGKATVWILIKPARAALLPRASPAFYPINSNEIVILGGHIADNICSDEVILFDIQTEKCKRIGQCIIA